MIGNRRKRAGEGKTTSKGRSEPVRRSGEAVPTDGWTGGMSLGRKAISAGIILALCSGPTAIALVINNQGSSEARNSTQKPSPNSADRDRAGAFAVQFVIAWLKSSKADARALDAFGTFPPGSLPDQPQQATDAVVATTEPGKVSDVWSVTIAVRVLEAQSTTPGAPNTEPAQRWVLRWFQVPVASSAGAMIAGTLPTPIPAPATLAKFPGLAYRENLVSTGTAATTVSHFLTALFTGHGGDLGRYVSPSADPGIQPLDPAPYASLSISTVTATKPAADKPVDGDTVQVIASVTLIDSAGSRRLSDVPLVLAARAGRWEVVAMPALPEIEQDPTPTPTNTTTP